MIVFSLYSEFQLPSVVCFWSSDMCILGGGGHKVYRKTHKHLNEDFFFLSPNHIFQSAKQLRRKYNSQEIVFQPPAMFSIFPTPYETTHSRWVLWRARCFILWGGEERSSCPPQRLTPKAWINILKAWILHCHADVWRWWRLVQGLIRSCLFHQLHKNNLKGSLVDWLACWSIAGTRWLLCRTGTSQSLSSSYCYKTKVIIWWT